MAITFSRSAPPATSWRVSAVKSSRSKRKSGSTGSSAAGWAGARWLPCRRRSSTPPAGRPRTHPAPVWARLTYPRVTRINTAKSVRFRCRWVAKGTRLRRAITRFLPAKKHCRITRCRGISGKSLSTRVWPIIMMCLTRRRSWMCRQVCCDCERCGHSGVDCCCWLFFVKYTFRGCVFCIQNNVIKERFSSRPFKPKKRSNF